jgi:hypothetical protein
MAAGCKQAAQIAASMELQAGPHFLIAIFGHTWSAAVQSITAVVQLLLQLLLHLLQLPCHVLPLLLSLLLQLLLLVTACCLQARAKKGRCTSQCITYDSRVRDAWRWRLIAY